MMPRLLVLAGATGTGKSELGITLAERLGGEVVNADAMQLYRGMDIGTAKTPPAERRGVPHHLLDVLHVTETASVAAYQQQARAVIERLLAAQRMPILVGGSGLYIQAVIDEMAFPGTDPDVRRRYLQLVAERGPERMHGELRSLDPTAAATILPTDGRRIARALEVRELTGNPFTAKLPARGPARYDALILTVDRPTAQLDVRLAERVDAMMAAGFLDEVRGLLDAGLRRGTTARRALGYSQLIDVVDGKRSVEQAVADTVTGTRRLVRRQRSWFRRDPRRHDVDAADPRLLDAALALLRP
jgi:tRNA dimethylallyltransferase